MRVWVGFEYAGFFPFGAPFRLNLLQLAHETCSINPSAIKSFASTSKKRNSSKIKEPLVYEKKNMKCFLFS
jgi:hypothetical protein